MGKGRAKENTRVSLCRRNKKREQKKTRATTMTDTKSADAAPEDRQDWKLEVADKVRGGEGARAVEGSSVQRCVASVFSRCPLPPSPNRNTPTSTPPAKTRPSCKPRFWTLCLLTVRCFFLVD